MPKNRPDTKAFKCTSCGRKYWTPKSLKHHPCPGRLADTGKVVLPETAEETLERLERERA